MVLPPGRDAAALVRDLRGLAIVQTAYPEPLASPPPVTPSFVDDQGYNDHGTAVLGELIATNDAIGVTGIAHGAGIGLVNETTTADGYDLADAIDTAAAALGPGDVILIEQQTAGANGGCGASQVGCVAVEWVQAY